MKQIQKLIILVFLVILPCLSFTQPDPRFNGNGSGVGNTPVGGPVGSPIDGGTGILLLLAIGYGINKLKATRKKD